MLRLKQLQEGFLAYLYDDVAGSAFKVNIINDDKVGVAKRLSIYHDAYRLRIIGVLGSDYPNLKKYLGDNLFEHTARTYISHYPSRYPNMRWVGQHMAEHLSKTLPQHPIAAELASFEWSLGVAFDADDTPNIKLQDLTEISPENWANIMLKAHASMQLLSFKYNTLTVWKALNTGVTSSKSIKDNSTCLVWRKGLDSHFRTIDNLEKVALEKLVTGISFGDLCEFIQGEEVISEHAEIVAMQTAAQYLSNWINDGLIINSAIK